MFNAQNVKFVRLKKLQNLSFPKRCCFAGRCEYFKVANQRKNPKIWILKADNVNSIFNTQWYTGFVCTCLTREK